MPKPSTSTKSKLTFLETVYPPISNQEAVWLQKDPAVAALLRKSDFYMIAGRAEAKFLNIRVDEDALIVTFDFVIDQHFTDPVTLLVHDLPGVATCPRSDYWFEAGEKMIRIWDGPVNQAGSSVLEWFTTEKLIWDRSRGRRGVENFNHYRDAAKYDLLYVGIAKVGDSFDRLIARGHKARMEILANEPQRLPGARVTDETYLFLFKVQPLIMVTFELDHEFQDEDLNSAYNQKAIVADAEKAFVSLLKPNYNIIKFPNYPKGTDGLYGSGYVRYGYAIRECFSFNTAHGRIRGGRNAITGSITNDADAISVEGDIVNLFESGVDFPGEPMAASEKPPLDDED